MPEGTARQVELSNGCICCSLSEDLETTLTELLDGEPEVETIIIETTGIAEPLPISWTLSDAALCDRVRLAAVVTTVDAVEHERHRPVSPSVDAQVEYADILVVTKLDLVADTGPLVASLRELNDYAVLIARAPDEVADALWETLADPPSPASVGVEPVTSDRSHDFTTIAVTIDSVLDFEELTSALEALGPEFVRIKGVARVVDQTTGSDQVRLVVFHRVGARVSSEPVFGDVPTRVVAIGRTLDRAQLVSCIDSSVITSRSFQ